ncbi:hypothetical protein BC629DRAFT_1589253 [Irpex lacteus]|nr:hypothetical protein BC629DRAFT_1589253 [Irpex lacteus]
MTLSVYKAAPWLLCLFLFLHFILVYDLIVCTLPLITGARLGTVCSHSRRYFDPTFLHNDLESVADGARGSGTTNIRPVSKLVDNPPFPTDDKPAQVSDAFSGTLNPTLATPTRHHHSSSDRVYFAVHGRKVSYSSTRAFDGLLPLDVHRSPAQPTRLILEERADVVNVLLHSAYGLSADVYAPSFQVLCDTVEALRKYGLMPLPRYIYPEPRGLAVAVSSKTLHLTVYDMPMAMAERMGTQYLGRLHRLHNERMEEMKRFFNTNPPLHAERPSCSKKAQEDIRMDFMLACPEICIERILSPAGSVVDAAGCRECKNILKDEYDQVLRSWSQLQTSI